MSELTADRKARIAELAYDLVEADYTGITADGYRVRRYAGKIGVDVSRGGVNHVIAEFPTERLEAADSVDEALDVAEWQT